MAQKSERGNKEVRKQSKKGAAPLTGVRGGAGASAKPEKGSCSTCH